MGINIIFSMGIIDGTQRMPPVMHKKPPKGGLLAFFKDAYKLISS